MSEFQELPAHLAWLWYLLVTRVTDLNLHGGEHGEFSEAFLNSDMHFLP